MSDKHNRLAYRYFSLFVLFLLVVSWSGIIFIDHAPRYILLSYLSFSILSASHCAYYQFNHSSLKKNANNSFKSYQLTRQHFYNYSSKVLLSLLFIGVFVTLILFKQTLLGWQVYQIPSSSMFPSLHAGDVVLADTRPFTLTTLKKDDVVVFHHPKYNNQKNALPHLKNRFYIKRIIASAGDTVSIQNHQLLINNQPKQSNFTEREYANQLIQDDSFFVMGDNYNHSQDSRNWGQLPQGNIVGKYLRVIYRQK